MAIPKKLNIALLGLGRAGKFHIQSIQSIPGISLRCVVDVDESLARCLAKELQCDYSTVAEGPLGQADIDAVIVASPTQEHYRQIIAALDAGKPVFTEKPLGSTLEEIDTCFDLAKRNDLPLLVGFNRRFDPNFQELKRQIDAGVIGEVELVTILSRDPGAPPVDYIRVSGGLYRDMMIHDIDMARWLVGEEFTDVKAMGSVCVDPAIGEAGDVDTAVVNLGTASGKLVSISNSRRASYGYDQRIEVHGSKGMIQAMNVAESTVVTSTADGVRGEKPMHFFLERYEAAYRSEWDGFVKLVLEGEPGMPTQTDGLESLRIADLATRQVVG